MPDQPGVYLALRIDPNDMPVNSDDSLSETHSTHSYHQSLKSMVSNSNNLSLKKHIFAADYFLDMQKLPRKTQTILTKFEMIVIAKILAVTPE